MTSPRDDFGVYLQMKSSEALSILQGTGYPVDLPKGIGHAGYNAIRHAYVSASLHLDYGETVAVGFGYYREYNQPAGIEALFRHDVGA